MAAVRCADTGTAQRIILVTQPRLVTADSRNRAPNPAFAPRDPGPPPRPAATSSRAARMRHSPRRRLRRWGAGYHAGVPLRVHWEWGGCVFGAGRVDRRGRTGQGEAR